MSEVCRCGCRTSILRANDEDFDAFAYEGFNVGLFLAGIALAEQNFCTEAGALEGVLESGLILNPSWLILGRKYYADLGFGEGKARYHCKHHCNTNGAFHKDSSLLNMNFSRNAA